MVVIAAGARYRRLEVPRTEYFEKVSVYYPASQAEAQLCRGDPAVIVGGGNFAGQAAVFLARHAARVTPSNECGRRKTALTLTRRRR
jgi:thioredoxin reductase (NADPH)